VGQLWRARRARRRRVPLPDYDGPHLADQLPTSGFLTVFGDVAAAGSGNRFTGRLEGLIAIFEAAPSGEFLGESHSQIATQRAISSCCRGRSAAPPVRSSGWRFMGEGAPVSLILRAARLTLLVALSLAAIVTSCSQPPTVPTPPPSSTSPPVPPPPPTGPLTGVVFESSELGRRPLPGAQVTVEDFIAGLYGFTPMPFGNSWLTAQPSVARRDPWWEASRAVAPVPSARKTALRSLLFRWRGRPTDSRHRSDQRVPPRATPRSG
jgi:hypothetical protein